MKAAFVAAKTPADMKAVEEDVLAEIDEVMGDIHGDIGNLHMMPGADKEMVKTLEKLEQKIAKKIAGGLSVKEMIAVVKQALQLENRIQVFKAAKAGGALQKLAKHAAGSKAAKAAKALATAAEGDGEDDDEKEDDEEGDLSSLDDEAAEHILAEAAAAVGGSDKVPRVSFKNGPFDVEALAKKWRIKFDGEELTMSSPIRKLESAAAAADRLADERQKQFLLQKSKDKIHRQEVKEGKKGKKAKRGKHAKKEASVGGGAHAAGGGGRR